MGKDRLTQSASMLVLLAAVTLTPGKALAGGPGHSGANESPALPAYAAAMPGAYPFTGVIVEPSCPNCFYTLPIQAVYQCPAVLAGQPGSRVEWLPSDPMPGILGGQPYLYHY